MKKFAGHKSLKVIRAQCKAAGLHLNMQPYLSGDDSISVWSRKRDDGTNDVESGYVIFNTANGKFFGKTPVHADPARTRFMVGWPSGASFDSSSIEFEDHPWFQQLLSFFLVAKS